MVDFGNGERKGKGTRDEGLGKRAVILLLWSDPSLAAKTNTRPGWGVHNGNSQGVKNKESDDHPDIYVCGPLKKPWAEFWAKTEDFG